MSFVDHFDRTYLINLPTRKDRLRRAMRELEAQGVAPGRVLIFPAVRPESADGPDQGTMTCASGGDRGQRPDSARARVTARTLRAMCWSCVTSAA